MALWTTDPDARPQQVYPLISRLLPIRRTDAASCSLHYIPHRVPSNVERQTTYILKRTSSSSSCVLASTCSVKRMTGSNWWSWDSSCSRSQHSTHCYICRTAPSIVQNNPRNARTAFTCSTCSVSAMLIDLAHELHTLACPAANTVLIRSAEYRAGPACLGW